MVWQGLIYIVFISNLIADIDLLLTQFPLIFPTPFANWKALNPHPYSAFLSRFFCGRKDSRSSTPAETKTSEYGTT